MERITKEGILRRDFWCDSDNNFWATFYNSIYIVKVKLRKENDHWYFEMYSFPNRCLLNKFFMKSIENLDSRISYLYSQGYFMSLDVKYLLHLGFNRSHGKYYWKSLFGVNIMITEDEPTKFEPTKFIVSIKDFNGSSSITVRDVKIFKRFLLTHDLLDMIYKT